MAKPKRNPKKQSRSAFLLLLLLILITPVVAALFFEDFREVPYGWIVGIIWFMASFFAFGFGIIYFGQFILPHHEGESWLEGINMLLRAATQARAQPKRARKAALSAGKESLPASFESLKAGILRSYQVLAINKGTNFGRPAGPGFVRLNAGESPGELLDLRKYVRSQQVNANTGDGIPLVAKVKVQFQIKPAEKAPGEYNPVYPYLRSAIFHVCQASSVDENNELVPLIELVTPEAAAYLVSELAQIELNELSEQPRLLNDIQKRIRRELRTNFDKMGIKIIDVIVTMEKLPQEIVQQRLANWRAHWESKIDKEVDKRNAKINMRLKRIQAQTQVEIINEIVRNIESIQGTPGTTMPQVVNSAIMKSLDEAIAKVMGASKAGAKGDKDQANDS